MLMTLLGYFGGIALVIGMTVGVIYISGISH